MTHICVGKITIIASDNGLSPERRQAIIWTNAGLLSIGTLRTYFSEILIKIQQFSLKKMHLKMTSAKRRLCCRGLNVLSAQHKTPTAIPLKMHATYIWHMENCVNGLNSCPNTPHPHGKTQYIQHNDKYYLHLAVVCLNATAAMYIA